VAVIDQVRDLKLMSGAQIQTVHFSLDDHATNDAAARACRRVLRRLTSERLLVRLERRIGGIRGGSAGFVYAASPLGHRILERDGARRRFREPSATFVHHTLSISQLVVDLIELQRAKKLDILRLEPEPRCWRTLTSPAGVQTLRPDLFVSLGVGEYEHHWFIEMDLGTETVARRLVKCKQYDAYYRTGREQADHGLFPKVLWIVPRQSLADDLQRAVQNTRNLDTELFEVTTNADALGLLAGSSA
jgi:hypothetical protein